MSRIFLSPSTQEHNAYTGGSTEETQMRAICLLAAEMLRSAGHAVTVGGAVSASDNVTTANRGTFDWYVAAHSDAGGGDGTTVFHYPGSSAGLKLAIALYSAVAPLSPGADNGVRSRANLIETNGPKAPSALIEIEFHDNKAGAAHIRAHHADYARALTAGILKVAPATIKPAPADDRTFRELVVLVPNANRDVFSEAVYEGLGLKNPQMKAAGNKTLYFVHVGNAKYPKALEACQLLGKVIGDVEVTADNRIRYQGRVV